MLILSRVCADFRNAQGRVIFRIAPADRLSFLEAPEEIRCDPLFDMLLAEGSLEAVHSVSRKKELEKDPNQGTDAAGKRKHADPGKTDSAAGTEPSGKSAEVSGAGVDPASGTAAPKEDETGISGNKAKASGGKKTQ